MSEVVEPRYHDQWRSDRVDREEDAACLFGHYLIKNCREEAIVKIPHATGSSEHAAAVAAIEHALFAVMELFGGYRPLDAGRGKQLELLLHARIVKDEVTVEEIRIPPDVDFYIGYWRWVEDYGTTPKAVA
jgi:hypothetical protein